MRLHVQLRELSATLHRHYIHRTLLSGRALVSPRSFPRAWESASRALRVSPSPPVSHARHRHRSGNTRAAQPTARNRATASGRSASSARALAIHPCVRHARFLSAPGTYRDATSQRNCDYARSTSFASPIAALHPLWRTGPCRTDSEREAYNTPRLLPRPRGRSLGS